MIVPNFYDLKDISDVWEDNAAKIIKIMKNNPDYSERLKILLDEFNEARENLYMILIDAEGEIHES
jgi:hypothetical protein